MKQWTDKSTSEKDIYDKAVEFTQLFIKQNFSAIAKIFPPLLGFAIFLSYFYQHKFYPSFDLFQFSSLLLSAFILGIIVIGALIAALSAPGFLVFYLFLNTKEIKEEITYALPYTKDKRDKTILLLLGVCYYLPFVVSTLAMTTILLYYTTLYSLSFFIIPTIIALCAGITLQHLFKLPKFSFIKYTASSYAAMLLINFLGFGIALKSSDFIESVNSEVLRTAILFCIPTAITIIATTCSMGYFAGFRFVLNFSTFFAILIASYSGILTTLPEKTMNHLGLGNYTAEKIILSSDYCDSETSKFIPTGDCTLHDAHVVWSFGENLALTLNNQDDRLIQIPSRFIKTIIKSTKNNSNEHPTKKTIGDRPRFRSPKEVDHVT